MLIIIEITSVMTLLLRVNTKRKKSEGKETRWEKNARAEQSIKKFLIKKETRTLKKRGKKG